MVVTQKDSQLSVIDLRDRSADRPFLIVHSSDEMYGADRMLLEFVAALPARVQARVQVWLPSDVEHGGSSLCTELEKRGIAFRHLDLPILRRRYLTVRGLAGVAQRWRNVRREVEALDPEQLLLATSAVLPLVVGMRRRSRTKVILHLQEIWGEREGRVLGQMARRVDQIIAISKAARASLPEKLQERADVVPNGTLDPGLVTPVSERSGELVFLIASRWNSWKGHEVLLQAWEQAGGPGRLMILGGPPSLGQAVDVRGMVAASSVRDTITIVGEVADTGAQIDQADVVIVPSTSPEPFGLVTIEAFAHGRPVIATAAGGSAEIVSEGTGWLVPPGDVQALAEILHGLDRWAVNRSGVRARERFEDRYSIGAFGAGLRAALGLAGQELVADLTDHPVAAIDAPESTAPVAP